MLVFYFANDICFFVFVIAGLLIITNTDCTNFIKSLSPYILYTSQLKLKTK